jgi:hypothetical protein
MAQPWTVRLATLVLTCTALGAAPAAAQVVTGRITTAADSTPLPGVAVTLFDTTRLVAVVRTDSSGQFRVRGPAPGDYRVYVVHSGFAHFVSADWLRLERARELRIDVELQPTTTAQALPAVVIDAERESLRKRRVGGRDLRAVPGEIITRSEIAMIAADAVSVNDIVRSRRIIALRVNRDLCLETLQTGPRRGARSMGGLFGGGTGAFGGNGVMPFDGSDETQYCLQILVDEVVWANPGDSEDAYYAVAGLIKPDDIDWMFVERSRGTPITLHIYTKSFARYAHR